MEERPRPSLRQFIRDLRRNWAEDSVGDTAAALTYYGVLALFPFLLHPRSDSGRSAGISSDGDAVLELGA
jgi:uncharacterized BrkB/YihY/UPF0761 family membrane protein